MWEYFFIRLVDALYALGRVTGNWFEEHGINVLVILLGAWAVRCFGAGLINRVLRRTIRPDLYPTKADREKRFKTLDSIVVTAMRVVVYAIAAILIVGEINPSYTTALFASAGFIGVALGFGAQSLIKDFASGVFIISENQYRVGDVVKLGDMSGIVEDVTIRTTVLRDLDGNVHHIPNGTVQVTTNMTMGFSRVNENIIVGYDTDINRLQHIIDHIGKEMAADADLKPKILQPPHFERVDGFGENGIVVKVLAETITGEQWLIKGELYKRLKVAFEKNHIEIPYQHLVLHETEPAKR